MKSLVGCCTITWLVAAPVLAHHATVSLEVDGSNIVEWAAVEQGFVLDIVITSDAPGGMSAFGVTLDGDPGFAYAGFTTREVVPGSGLFVIDNYNSATGWDNTLGGFGVVVGPGNLPMGGGVLNEEIATWHGTSGLAQNGHAAWIEFTGLPEPGNYVITAREAYVGDAEYKGTEVTVVPLEIVVTPEPSSFGLLALALPAARRARQRHPLGGV